MAVCLLAAWCLAGCPVSQVDSARQGAVPEQPGEQPETPRTPEPGATPALSIAGASTDEGTGTLAFVVTLSGAARGAVSVQYATADGTATAGADYEEARGTLRFPAGSAAPLPIAVTVKDDTVAEQTETFTVRLSNAHGAQLANATATGTIRDDDTAVDTDDPASPDDTGDTADTGDDYGDTQRAAATVMPATVASAQEPIAGHLETAGDVDYFRAVVDAGATVHAHIDPATQPGNLRRRAFVTIETGGFNSLNADGYDAVAVGSTKTVFFRVWTPGGAPRRYDLAIWLSNADEPEDPAFDIELTYSSASKPSASQQSVFRAAADHWERVITAGMAAQFIFTANLCRNGMTHPFGAFVDDLHVDIRLARLDGPGNTLASAAICSIRADGGLPWAAVITIDSQDLDQFGNDTLRLVALHEIGHALGFGASAAWDGLVRNSAQAYERSNPGSTTLPDAHFAGAAAVSAFNEIASSYAHGKVPVENDTGTHSESALDNHWRESLLGTELMSTVLSSSSEQLSKITIAALADLGYEVDYTLAEPYTLPAGSTLRLHLHDQVLRDQVHRGPLPGSAIPNQQIPFIP